MCVCMCVYMCVCAHMCFRTINSQASGGAGCEKWDTRLDGRQNTEGLRARLRRWHAKRMDFRAQVIPGRHSAGREDAKSPSRRSGA